MSDGQTSQVAHRALPPGTSKQLPPGKPARAGDRIVAGEYLLTGQQLEYKISGGSSYALEVVDDSYLSLSRRNSGAPSDILWITKPEVQLQGSMKAVGLVVKSDGLELYPLSWAEKPPALTKSKKTTVLALSKDGSLNLYSEAGSNIVWTAKPNVISTADRASKFAAGQFLPVSQSMISANGGYKLSFSDDGTFCVEDMGKSGGRKGDLKYYYTGVGNSGAKFLTVTKDGRLQILGTDQPSAILWDSEGEGQGQGAFGEDASFTLFNDGSFSVATVGPNEETDVWKSRNLASGSLPQPYGSLSTSTSPPPNATKTLRPGDSLVSPNGLHYLLLNTNGSVGLYSNGSGDNDFRPGRVLLLSQQVPGALNNKSWAVTAALLPNGQLGVFGADKKTPINVLGTAAKAAVKEATLTMQLDGTFKVTTSAGVELWNSKSLPGSKKGT